MPTDSLPLIVTRFVASGHTPSSSIIKSQPVLNFVQNRVRKENRDNIEDVKDLFSHSALVPISLSRANLTPLFGSVFKSVVNCGPHSRSGGTTQEIMESQERSACRYHSYYCVQYLLHHSHSPSVMRGYRLHKPVSTIPSHSLPRHHRLTRGLTLSLILYVVYFSRRINWSGQKSKTKNCSVILNAYVGSSGL